MIGDPFDDPRTAFQVLVLKKGWQALATFAPVGARLATVHEAEDAIVVRLAGEMSEMCPGRSVPREA